jgi:predicted unusual protein kinase regulating ubiquinone biosynthesis (AarF/ABC1/UbiB family)
VFDGLREESDFALEVKNLNKMRNFLAKQQIDVLVPAVDGELSTKNLIVMSRVPGVSLETLDQIPTEIKQKIIFNVMNLAMAQNLMHADLHAGNVFLDLETQQISFIDCGLVVEISDSTKELLIQLFNNSSDAIDLILKKVETVDAEMQAELVAIMNDTPDFGSKIVALQAYLEKYDIVISENFDKTLLALVKMAYLFTYSGSH